MTGFAFILKSCAEHYGFSPMALISLRRDKEAGKAIGAVMYVARNYLGMTYLSIAEAAGFGSDRSGAGFVAKAIARINKERTEDPELQAAIAALERAISQRLDEQVDELVKDLPDIQMQYEDGPTIEAIADWYGVKKNHALALSEAALARGAVTPVYTGSMSRICKVLPLY